MSAALAWLEDSTEEARPQPSRNRSRLYLAYSRRAAAAVASVTTPPTVAITSPVHDANVYWLGR